MRLILFILLTTGCGERARRDPGGGAGADVGAAEAPAREAGEGEDPGRGEGGAPEGADDGGEEVGDSEAPDVGGAEGVGEGEGEGVGEGEGEGEGEGGQEDAMAWSDGPYGHAWFDLAGGFSFPEAEGDWDFQPNFDGADSYVFVGYSDNVEYVQGLWRSSLRWLLQDSPPNVHYFFYAMPDRSGRHRVFEFMGPLIEQLEEAFERLDPDDADHWRQRVHLLGAPTITMTGWLKEAVVDRGRLLFAIDRFQQLRQLGLLGQPGRQAFTPELHFIANEVRHYNFEFARAQELASQTVDLVPIMQAHPHGGGWGAGHSSTVRVELPSAEKLATYDTAELDMHMQCADNDDSNCPEWDRTSHLRVCEWQTEDGGGDPIDEECEPAAEQECSCGSPSRGSVSRTRICNEEGAQWSACRCGCEDELGRWITTYRREGRWVTDVSPLLPLLPGGPVDMRYICANGQSITVTLRLSNRGKATRPRSLLPLFGGGSFRPGSNERYTPLGFTAPAGTSKVELVTMITGHGFGKDADNCAEFCNHTHHFDINGEEFVKTHPAADDSDGCKEQVDLGVVPNQFGTWPFGRAGWCPGLEVAPWVVDVTAAVDLEGPNTVSYRALLEGNEYVPRNQADGFNPNITMSSWLVFSD